MRAIWASKKIFLNRPYRVMLGAIAIWSFLLSAILPHSPHPIPAKAISPASRFGNMPDDKISDRLMNETGLCYLNLIMKKAFEEEYGREMLEEELNDIEILAPHIAGIKEYDGFYIEYLQKRSGRPLVLHYFLDEKFANTPRPARLGSCDFKDMYFEILPEKEYDKIKLAEDFNARTSAGGAIKGVKVLLSPEGGCQEEIIKAIKSAREKIDAAVYNFTNEKLKDALIRRAKDGVKIRLFLDKSQKGKKFLKELLSRELKKQKADIRVEYDERKHALMHNKFMIIDKKKIISGSYNWTPQAEKENRENLIILPYMQIFQDQFNAMLKGKRLEPANIRGPPREITAVFSPKGGCEEALIELIRHVREKARHGGKPQHIEIALFYFTNKDIAKELFEAKENGVDVSIVLDKGQKNRGDSILRYFNSLEARANKNKRNAKGRGRTKRGRFEIGYHRIANCVMHNKFAIIGDVTVTGSYNWTMDAESRNRENLIILPGVIEEYRSEFERLRKDSDVYELNKKRTHKKLPHL